MCDPVVLLLAHLALRGQVRTTVLHLFAHGLALLHLLGAAVLRPVAVLHVVDGEGGHLDGDVRVVQIVHRVLG